MTAPADAVTCFGACTATSGSSGNSVGSGGSSDEASVAADCLSWLRGCAFDCCKAAVCSVGIEMLPASAAALLVMLKLVARINADKATEVHCPARDCQHLLRASKHSCKHISSGKLMQFRFTYEPFIADLRKKPRSDGGLARGLRNSTLCRYPALPAHGNLSEMAKGGRHAALLLERPWLAE